MVVWGCPTGPPVLGVYSTMIMIRPLGRCVASTFRLGEQQGDLMSRGHLVRPNLLRASVKLVSPKHWKTAIILNTRTRHFYYFDWATCSIGRSATKKSRLRSAMRVS